MHYADFFQAENPEISTRKNKMTRSLVSSAALGVLLISSSVYANTSGFVIGRITAQGPVTVGEGAQELSISDSVEPYFGGENVTTMDGATAVVRMGGESATLQVPPSSRISANVDGSGSYDVQASGNGVEFQFSGNEQFVVRFDCLNIQGGVADGSTSSSHNSGKVVLDGGQLHVKALKGELSLTTTAGQKTTIRSGESYSGCDSAVIADSTVTGTATEAGQAGSPIVGAFAATTTVVVALLNGQRNSTNRGLLDISGGATGRPASNQPDINLNGTGGSSTANTTKTNKTNTSKNTSKTNTRKNGNTGNPIKTSVRPGKKTKNSGGLGNRPVKVPPKIVETTASPVGGKGKRKSG